MDLEREFQKLMDEAVQKVQERHVKGELSVVEADDLIDLIARRRYENDGWSSSTRACMDSYEYDEGWNRSGQAC